MHEKWDRVVANAESYSKQGKRRELITQKEKVSVEDNLELNTLQKYVNKREFAGQNLKRWGIPAPESDNEFEILAADKLVPQIRDERNWRACLRLVCS